MDYMDYIEENHSYNNVLNPNNSDEHISCYMCESKLDIVCNNDELPKEGHAVIKVRCPHCNYLNYMIYYSEYRKKGKKK